MMVSIETNLKNCDPLPATVAGNGTHPSLTLEALDGCCGQWDTPFIDFGSSGWLFLE